MSSETVALYVCLYLVISISIATFATGFFKKELVNRFEAPDNFDWSYTIITFTLSFILWLPALIIIIIMAGCQTKNYK